MSENYAAAVEELIWQGSQLEDGPAKVAMLEEAVRLADTHRDVELGFTARNELIRAANFSGEPEKSLVAFSWCLAQADRDPEKFAGHNLLWTYKWVSHSLGTFPQISKQQIAAMLADMARRYQQAGSTLRAVYMKQFQLAREMGDKAEARHFYRLWKKTPRDWLSDCHACEVDLEIAYLRGLGKDEEALQTAEPILRGSLRCAEVPHCTFGQILLPLLRLGRLDEAARYHERGYRMTSSNPTFLDTVTEHLEYVILTGNLAKAVKLLEKHLSWALASSQLGKAFAFYRAGLFLIERLQKSGKETMKLRLPANFPELAKDGKYELDQLHAWFSRMCRDLAEQFDRRNENTFFSRQIRDVRKLHELAK